MERLRVDDRILISVLLLVIQCDGCGVHFIESMPIRPERTHRGIHTNILPKSLLDHSISTELFIWLDKHLSGCTIILHHLKEGVIVQLDSCVWIIEQYLISCQPCVL